MQKRENNLSGAWFPTKLYLYYSRALKRVEETAEHGSVMPNPRAPTPSLRVLQAAARGLGSSTVGWEGRPGEAKAPSKLKGMRWDVSA